MKRQPLTVTPETPTIAQVAQNLEAMATTVRALENPRKRDRERAARQIRERLGKNFFGAYTFAAVLPRDARALHEKIIGETTQ